MKEIEFKYEGILAEENLQLSDLPVAIRKSINALKPNYARYQKNPSDAMRNSLIQMDVDVSNQILNWLEEELEEEERLQAEEEAARLKAEQEAAAKAEQERLAAEAKAKADEEARLAEEQAKIDAEAAAKLKEEEEAAAAAAAAAAEAAAKAEQERIAAEEAAKAKSYKFGTSEMAKIIKEKVEANGGHVLISELKAIIGKEPSYPYQEVYDMKLHKPYMKSYYVIV